MKRRRPPTRRELARKCELKARGLADRRSDLALKLGVIRDRGGEKLKKGTENGNPG